MADQYQEKIQFLDIQRFTGMNTLDEPHIIDPSESPYMVNMSLTRNGSIMTRFGYELATEIPAATGPMNGALPAYFTTVALTEDRLVLFHDGDLYYVTNQNWTPTSISGSYGADRNHMQGMMFLDHLIFGNGAGPTLTWDGTTVAALDPSGTPAEHCIFAVFENTPHYAGDPATPSTVFYADAGTLYTTPVDLGIDEGNGQVITALVSNNDVLQVYKENMIKAITTTLDSNGNFVVPQVTPVINANGGAFAGGSTQSALGYTYYLSNSGVETYGSSENKIQGNLPLPLSYKIDPTIKNINMLQRQTMSSAYFDNKYFVAVPMASQTDNENILVYDENFKRRFGVDNWVYWNIPVLDEFVVFRDENFRDQLYFTSATEPKLYRMNTSFADDQYGYTRLWQSKTFRFGERTSWQYIDIEGSKPLGAVIYVDITTDGVTYSGIEVTDADFMQGGSDTGYLGDSYLGDMYTGAAFSTTVQIPMYRWKKRVRVPESVNYGYEMYVTIRNEAVSEGWKLTRVKIAYIIDPDDPSYAYTD